MKQKKVLVGVIATALALGTGAAAYAAEPQSSDGAAVQAQGEISTVREGVLSFDETALPEGVQFAQEVSEGGEGDNRVQSIATGDVAGDVEGTLSFGETGLPEGVQFATEGSNSVANGVMGLE